MRLKSRTRPIPHGLKFVQPEVGWDSVKAVGRSPSWETLVNAVVAMRLANPHHQQKHKWATDVESVANEVDAYNTHICLANGWNNFVTGGTGGAPPLPLPQSRNPENEKLLSVAAKKATKIFNGVKTLNDWLDSGEPPVPEEQSESRAAICVACPLNGKGDLTRFFTVPAAAAIKRQMERLHHRAIHGTLDAHLGVCEACLCPLVLKTKTPLKFITPHMSDETVSELRRGKDCWLVREMEAS